MSIMMNLADRAEAILNLVIEQDTLPNVKDIYMTERMFSDGAGELGDPELFIELATELNDGTTTTEWFSADTATKEVYVYATMLEVLESLSEI